jgi:hypothetical protein
LRAVGYLLAPLVLILAVAFSSNIVFASPCSIQLGYPIIPLASSSHIVTVVVPVSATCSSPYGKQLYATASAYDLNTDVSASAVNTIVTSVDGGYTFTGQLGFNLPPSTQGHWVQIAVTLYESESGGKLTTAGEAFPVTAGTGQVVTATVTEQASYAFAPPSNESSQQSMFAYVAIAAILATVIIVTVGLVVYSTRPAEYYRSSQTV